jgi:hypothetical protein
MEQALRVTFAGLAVVFSIWIVVTLLRWSQYRKISGSVVLSWAPRRPWYYSFCLGIGFFMVFLTGLSAFVLHRPPLVVVAQALMAVFYTAVFPLIFKMRIGFYNDGIWSERGFVPYRSIRWLGWKSTPDITLALRAEGRLGQKYAFLKVPGDFYGRARRILAESIEKHNLSLETSVLGLDSDAPIQERV